MKISVWKNPRLEPLVTGAVTVAGEQVEWELGHPAQLHPKHVAEDDADAFEFGLGTYLLMRGRPEYARLRWTGVPVFLAKGLIFLMLQTRSLDTLADLRGKRVGVPDYHITIAVWLRATLRLLHGIEASEIDWVSARGPERDAMSGTRAAPRGVSLETAEAPLAELLARGALDAAFDPGMQAPAGVRPLLDRAAIKRTVAELHSRHGVSPINHVLLVQQRLVDADPALARRLYDAFEGSKQAAYRQDPPSRSVYPGPADDLDEQRRVFGDDPYPSGVAANRRTLDALADQLSSEGILAERVDAPELFAPTVRGT